MGETIFSFRAGLPWSLGNTHTFFSRSNNTKNGIIIIEHYACSMMCAWRSSKNENFRRKYKTACQRVRKKPKYQEMPTEKAIHTDTEDNNCVQINWWLCYVCETMSHCLCGAYTYAYRGLCGHILFINNLASFSSVVVASLLFFSLCDGIRFVANCFLKTINFHMFMFLTRTQPICFLCLFLFFSVFFLLLLLWFLQSNRCFRMSYCHVYLFVYFLFFFSHIMRVSIALSVVFFMNETTNYTL